MRTGAAHAHEGYFHESAFYASDDELLDIAVPFLTDGISAGEPVIVTFAEHNAALVRHALGPRSAHVDFLPGADQYARPVQTIRQYRDMFSRLVAGGATQIRVVGDVPHTGTGFDWNQWVRYEAAVNHAYDDFPVWGMCPYDTRTAPDHVLDGVARTHPHIATRDGGHHPNPRFEDPAEFWRALEPPPHATRPADVILVEPTVREARQRFVDAARAAALGEREQEAVVLAVSELVTNAIVHGRPPFLVEGWVDPGRVELSVIDSGTGPDAAFLGLMPQAASVGGRGLWIAQQLCDDLVLDRRPDGFVARAVVTSRGADA